MELEELLAEQVRRDRETQVWHLPKNVSARDLAWHFAPEPARVVEAVEWMGGEA